MSDTPLKDVIIVDQPSGEALHRILAEIWPKDKEKRVSGQGKVFLHRPRCRKQTPARGIGRAPVRGGRAERPRSARAPRTGARPMPRAGARLGAPGPVHQVVSITQDELQTACEEFGIEDARLEEMIREIDQNNDGRVDYNEFVEMMHKGNADFGKKGLSFGLREALKLG